MQTNLVYLRLVTYANLSSFLQTAIKEDYLEQRRSQTGSAEELLLDFG